MLSIEGCEVLEGSVERLREFWKAGVRLAALTAGSLFRGVLEIYGTTNRLGAVYWICGAALCGLGLAVYGFCRMVALPQNGE